MTSPFPAHQYELIVALLKACKINGTGERNTIISTSKRPSSVLDEWPGVANTQTLKSPLKKWCNYVKLRRLMQSQGALYIQEPVKI